MAVVTPFGVDLNRLDLENKTADELIKLKEKLSAWFDALQDEEPEDPESPECLKWLNLISDIEDAMDEIDEMLE